MKGPQARTKHDVRRVWECPVCGHRVLRGGEVVGLVCECQAAAEPPQRTFMRLVESARSPAEESSS
jgi:hypothetical protein